MSVESRLIIGLLASLTLLGLVALWWIDPDGWRRR